MEQQSWDESASTYNLIYWTHQAHSWDLFIAQIEISLSKIVLTMHLLIQEL